MLAASNAALLTLTQAKRDSAAYLEMVEKGKAFQAMDDRHAASHGSSGGGGGDFGGGDTGGGAEGDDGRRRVRRKFRQAQPVKDVGGDAVDADVLRAVFAPK